MPNENDACAACEADLSALIDGELTPEREDAVRAHLAACAVCSERIEALCNVDLALAAVPVPEVPGHLRARLWERIERDVAAAPEPAVAAAEAAVAPEALPPPHPAPAQAPQSPAVAPPPRRRRWLSRPAVGAAIAAAAVLALYLAATRGERRLPLELAPPPIVAEERAPAAEEVAEAASERPAPALPRERSPADVNVLTGADEAELAVVLALETIEDLDVIANLDLLESWAALEDGASG